MNKKLFFFISYLRVSQIIWKPAQAFLWILYWVNYVSFCILKESSSMINEFKVISQLVDSRFTINSENSNKTQRKDKASSSRNTRPSSERVITHNALHIPWCSEARLWVTADACCSQHACARWCLTHRLGCPWHWTSMVDLLLDQVQLGSSNLTLDTTGYRQLRDGWHVITSLSWLK